MNKAPRSHARKTPAPAPAPSAAPPALLKAEWLAAGLLTLGALWLRFEAARCAGGLWRDEANTVALAGLPKFSDVWQNLQFDSYPISWLAVVRCLLALGLQADWQFRTVGFFVGLLILAALWFSARRLRISFPFFSLVLLGFCPAFVCFGDSMRGYGFGAACILLECGLVWNVVESPAPGRVVAAAVGAICAVQALYQNAVLLLALCVAGMVVSLARRQRKTALLLLLIGLLAAASLLPYLPVILQASEWTPLVQAGFSFSSLALGFRDAVRPEALLVIWLVCLAAALLLGGGALFLKKPALSPAHKDLLLFAATALAVAIIGYITFIKTLDRTTRPWHWLSLLALCALNLDAIFSVFTSRLRPRILRLLLPGIAAAALIWPVAQRVHLRLTNIDLIAAKLNASAAEEDLILLDPWFVDVSFNHYYSGRAPWMTVPPVGFYRFHRYDLLKQLMMAPDQMAPLRPALDQVAQTLQSGHRVWLVGGLRSVETASPPSLIPPAPARLPRSYSADLHETAWAGQVDYFLVTRAARIEDLLVPSPIPVFQNENALLLLLQGWRTPAPGGQTNPPAALAGKAGLDDALSHWEAAKLLAPQLAVAHVLLGNALAAGSPPEDLVPRFQQVLRLQPRLIDTRLQLAALLLQCHRSREALQEYRLLRTLAPDSFEPLNNLAWILATDPDPQFRNGPEAVQLAEQAIRLPNSDPPSAQDTLAAALAESGRFRDAVEAIQKGITLAQAGGQTNSAAKFRLRLELYQAGKPFHQGL